MGPKAADILFKDKLAGTLIETASGGTCFTYDETWKKEDIACCFPITRREYEYSYGLHPFFQHLGPEGWLREQQARVAHIVEADDLGLLLRYGADCIGAVSVCPKEAVTAIDGTKALVNPGRTVSGIQKKLLVVKDGEHFSPALASGSAPYIAKFNSASILTLVHNEALSLQWMISVLGKKEVTEFRTAFIQPINEVALVVTRFDRDPAGTKRRLEDFAQILCKPKGLDYAGKYDAAYEDVAAIIKQYSARPDIDLALFYKRLITFALIGNGDAHLKNFSLLETSEGLRLAPVYDVVNTIIYPGYDQQLALSINGKKRQLDVVDRHLFTNFGQTIGLTDRTIAQVFDDLKRQVRKAASILKPSPADDPDGFKHRFEEIVRNACLRILEE